MDYNELKRELELSKIEIEGWHLFYESFIEHDMHITLGRSILVKMFSELYKAKLKNPKNESIPKAENRLENLEKIFDKMEGLNNRCVNLQKQLKEKVRSEIELMDKLQELEQELEAIKKAFKND